MKAAYLFLGSVSLLTAVACTNLDKESLEDEFLLPGVALAPDSPSLSLDSFQHYAVYTIPGNAPAAENGRNKLFIHREKDSVTYSGVFYAYDANRSQQPQQVYRFYFKAGKDFGYAYLKYTNRFQSKAGEQKLIAREAAYRLRFGAQPVVEG